MNKSSLFRRLQAASNDEKTQLAIQLGKRYVAARPAHAPGWLFYGRALAEAARYAEAKRAYTAGLACCPDDRMHHFIPSWGICTR